MENATTSEMITKKHNLSAGELKIIHNVKIKITWLKSTIQKYCTGNEITDFPVKISNANVSVANICGVSISTVKRCDKSFTGDKDSSRNKMTTGRKPILCDSFTVACIRQVCHRFYAQKEYPTIAKIRMKCLDDELFPRVCLKVFRKCVKKHCKFKYRKIFRKPVYLERTEIVAQREHYLRSIRNYRKLGYTIFYQDETWSSPNQTRNKCWQILLNKTEIQDFKRQWNGKVIQDVNGWSGGFLVKGGQGRVIINHIGGENGFLEGAEDIFVSKKDTSDYHSTMNGDHFQDWLRKVVDLVPDKSVIVLDMAPYHRKRIAGTIMPKMSWQKAKIVDWFEFHCIKMPSNIENFNAMTKATLIELSKQYPVKEEFIVEQIAAQSDKDIKILFLPVAHCELNPIELIWAFVKGTISQYNKTGGTKNVLESTKECIKLVTKDLWGNCIKHAIKYEDKFWERDRLIERNMEQLQSNPNLVFNVNDTSSSNSSDDDSSSENKVIDTMDLF